MAANRHQDGQDGSRQQPPFLPSEVVEVDVGGPYPATTNWDEYVITPYYFAETDETLDMLIETNSTSSATSRIWRFPSMATS